MGAPGERNLWVILPQRQESMNIFRGLRDAEGKIPLRQMR